MATTKLFTWPWGKVDKADTAEGSKQPTTAQNEAFLSGFGTINPSDGVWNINDVAGNTYAPSSGHGSWREGDDPLGSENFHIKTGKAGGSRYYYNTGWVAQSPNFSKLNTGVCGVYFMVHPYHSTGSNKWRETITDTFLVYVNSSGTKKVLKCNDYSYSDVKQNAEMGSGWYHFFARANYSSNPEYSYLNTRAWRFCGVQFRWSTRSSCCGESNTAGLQFSRFRPLFLENSAYLPTANWGMRAVLGVTRK